eukprot:CAMPEP_0197643340 /NCGR_PEP_ID=MMETSP1338-20131121/16695_1 /TAXON_ID=43686 ORGANISM="Pelagodinium beii, Strain RCC1491" /NCGR_SAMPLE_ID=MMETSP1338 /ASSEMBLY_ACC=CAM_ASM_000754 /LENGTH=49 /DNA_ID= /DNA_START= /DNA_END= /DNA_ORIENTATION=
MAYSVQLCCALVVSSEILQSGNDLKVLPSRKAETACLNTQRSGGLIKAA